MCMTWRRRRKRIANQLYRAIVPKRTGLQKQAMSWIADVHWLLVCKVGIGHVFDKPWVRGFLVGRRSQWLAKRPFYQMRLNLVVFHHPVWIVSVRVFLPFPPVVTKFTEINSSQLNLNGFHPVWPWIVVSDICSRIWRIFHVITRNTKKIIRASTRTNPKNQLGKR